MGVKTPSTDAVKQIHYLAAALKAPRITESAARLADQARDANWTHEDYLAAVLDREVSARNASGARGQILVAVDTLPHHHGLRFASSAHSEGSSSP